MDIFQLLKNSNGWQRIWMMFSIILFVLIVLTGDRVSHSIAMTEARIVEFEIETCNNKLKSIESNRDSYYEAVTTDKNICPWTIATIKSGYGPKNRYEAIAKLDELKKKQVTDFFMAVALWLFLVGALYGIGLIGRWVRRGGFGTKPDHN